MAATTPPVAPSDPSAVLIPPPWRARSGGERVRTGPAPRVGLEPPTAPLEAVRESLCEGLAALGLRPSVEPPSEAAGGSGAGRSTPVQLLLEEDGGDETPEHPEGYRLSVHPEAIRLAARTPAGLFYATRTLLQWLRAHRGPGGRAPAEVPALDVVDRPALDVRGVMLDVSRCRVPTLAELLRRVDRLADLKINHLQLYTEHTFAYRSHEVVWRDASPITPDDVRILDRHCRSRFIELVPNQNSLGHFHRWLTREPYRALAEVPEGIEHPFSDAREPFTLCPTDPGGLDLLADLYDQLFPCFASRWFNAGLDEPFDLGAGLSAAECAERGKTAVYIEFLTRVHTLVRKRDHRMLFWGDVVIEADEEVDPVASIPEEAVALEWGYDAGHPFPERAARYAASGLDFLLCPGTSSWSSLAGRSTNALHNLAEAARSAADSGALGVLITDWGDHGHLQPPAVSEVPLAAGAAFAWNADAARRPEALPLARAADLHLFDEPAGGLADAAFRLGDAHRRAGTPDRNGAALFFLLVFAHQDLTHERYEGLTAEGLEQAEEEVGEAAEAIRSVEGPADPFVVPELLWAARALEAACRIGRARLAVGRDRPLSDLPAAGRTALAERVGALVEEHAPLWLARSRPGGRIESVSRLERTLKLLRGE